MLLQFGFGLCSLVNVLNGLVIRTLLCQCIYENIGLPNDPENPSLGFERFECEVVQLRCGGCGCILQHHAIEATIVCLSHGGMHTNVSRHSGKNEVLDAFQTQDMLQISVGECTSSLFIDNDVARQWL